jgi:CubicO group peptidase (beta-lactamase class C family)
MNVMPEIVRQSGPFGPILVVLGGVVLFLTMRAVVLAMGRRAFSEDDLKAQTNGILFWGAASAVLGFLGQCQSAYLALTAILSATEIDPRIVAQGFVMTFFPSLIGLGIFAFAGVAWFSLRLFRGRIRAASVPLFALLAVFPSMGGCQARPESFTTGLWALDTGPNVFLWEFSGSGGGGLTCVVHDVLGGLLYSDTPCREASLDGDQLRLVMPNGVRYEGAVDLPGSMIRGALLYTDGSSREATLEWAPRADYPTLAARWGMSGPYQYSVPEARADGLEVATAEDAGVDEAALERAVDAVLRSEAGLLKSFLILRDGKLVLEEYFHEYGADDLFPIQSCTKSISSLLTGLAIQEGHISGIEAPLLEFFPDDRGGAGAGWEGLSLENLLTMSLALDWSPEEANGLHGTGPEAFRQILARDVVGRPGVDWQYVNMNVNLLAGVLHASTGEFPEAFAERTLFGPLGIKDWDWGHAKESGYNLMDGSLRLRARDMAKIGAMVTAEGVWRGEQVIRAEWVRSSLHPHLPAGERGETYGYLWWGMTLPGPDGEPVDVSFANGWGSQFIILIPRYDLVVVTTGGNHENGKHLAIGEILVRDLLPGLTGEAPLG